MRRLIGCAVVTVVSSLVFAGGASADSVTLCLSPGQPVTDANAGTCPSGTTPTYLASEADLEAARNRVGVLEALLTNVTRSKNAAGLYTLKISGENVQIVSGSGSTSGPVNGAGNLVLGYNESPGSQTGSHNLVLGTGQSFTSYGDVVGGTSNAAKAPFGAVFGNANTISGSNASVSGGKYSTASGSFSSITGGSSNTASGLGAFVGGGAFNKATAVYSSLTGGCANLAGTGTNSNSYCTAHPGYFPAVTGGSQNQASGTAASASGGYSNSASGSWSSVSAGYTNQATANFSSVSGGDNNVVGTFKGSILGGYFHTLTSSSPDATSEAGPTIFAP
jgi:hypothetical protein